MLSTWTPFDETGTLTVSAQDTDKKVFWETDVAEDDINMYDAILVITTDSEITTMNAHVVDRVNLCCPVASLSDPEKCGSGFIAVNENSLNDDSADDLYRFKGI